MQNIRSKKILTLQSWQLLWKYAVLTFLGCPFWILVVQLVWLEASWHYPDQKIWLWFLLKEKDVWNRYGWAVQTWSLKPNSGNESWDQRRFEQMFIILNISWCQQSSFPSDFWICPQVYASYLVCIRLRRDRSGSLQTIRLRHFQGREIMLLRSPGLIWKWNGF